MNEDYDVVVADSVSGLLAERLLRKGIRYLFWKKTQRSGLLNIAVGWSVLTLLVD